MSEGKHCEIERKYLIRMPDEGMLSSIDGCEIWQIEQIYLRPGPGCTRRIRRVVENGEARWYRTFKRRISALTSEEDEGRISAEEYQAYRKEADPERRAIVKLRYRIPYAGHILEIDVYPFWTDRAVLEIELEREDEQVRIPAWLEVIREVTDDARYKNVRLAKAVPMDEI